MNDLSDDKQNNSFEQELLQLFNAHLRGQSYNVEELVKQHPEHNDEIRNRIRKLHKINNLFDSIAQADERDFCATATGQYLTGRRIGNFEVVEMIGRGGMGVVYLASDTKLKRSVAIKSMPSEFQADQTAVTRFRREAELLASLNHPNIAVIHEIIEEEKTGHLILEYVQGETLAERIVRQPLTLEEVLSIGLQIAEAISAAHEKGVIHRDLKPSNIKITPEGRVKVLDFGLAKAHKPEEMADKKTVTHPGRVMGTPAYMSPEQARGKETDHRTDIWSLGCILFQMLTGRLPFDGETATDTLVKIVGAEPDWDLLPPEIPTSIRVLLSSCLEKDPLKRLGNIGKAVTEIRQALNKPVAPKPLLRGLTVRKVAVVVGGLIVVALFTVVAYIALIPRPVAFVDLSPESLQLTEDDYRMRGDEYSSRGYHNIDDRLNAIRMYEDATIINDESALAWAKLSQAYAAMFWFHGYSKEHLDKAEEAAVKALLLDKDLPEAHWAKGYCHYWGHYDFATSSMPRLRQ